MSMLDDVDRRRHARHLRDEQLVELGYLRAKLWKAIDGERRGPLPELRVDLPICADPVAVAALAVALVEVCRHEDHLLSVVTP